MIYALWTHIFSWCPGSKPIGIISISISTSIGTSTGNWFAAAYAERRPLMVDLKSEKSQFAFGIIQFFISLKYFWLWRNACISRSLQYSIFCRFVSLPLPCTHTHTYMLEHIWIANVTSLKCAAYFCAHPTRPSPQTFVDLCFLCSLGFLCVYLFIGICGKYEKPFPSIFSHVSFTAIHRKYVSCWV